VRSGYPESPDRCLFFLIFKYYLPNIAFMIVLPTLRSMPPFVAGMSVFLAIEFFNAVIPNNLCQEKENPNLSKFIKLFFLI
jgi:hypothetical protein